jgi:hypothetical protein
MNADHELERRIADFYATEAPTRAPERVLESALATIDTTPQRRALIRVPWRFPTMNTYAKFAIAAVAVIAVAGFGLAMLRPGTGSGIGAPGPTPSPTVSPTPSPSPDPSAPPPLGETFTSTIHGISISYPTGWVAIPATEAWTSSSGINFESPTQDRIHDPVLMDHLFLGLASQPLAGKTGESWVTDVFDSPELGCGDARQPITVDKASGFRCSNVVAVSSGDRGYLIWFYSSGDEPWLDRYYDEAWYQGILATVKLDPSAAVVPSPSTTP